MTIDAGLDVLLRTARTGDAARWLEMLQDADYRQYGAPAFVRLPADAAEAAEEFAHSVEDWAERRPGSLAVAVAGSRKAIVLLTRWLLDPDGRDLGRVQLDHSTENPASCRVALAAGFEQEGIRRGFLPLRDPDGVVRRHDVCLHGTITAPPLPR